MGASGSYKQNGDSKEITKKANWYHICCSITDTEVVSEAEGERRKQDDPADGVHLHLAEGLQA